MPYELHVTTKDGDSYVRPVESLDALDAILPEFMYHGTGRLVAVSVAPVTFIYAKQIKSITVPGLTKAEIDEHVQRKRQEHEQTMRELASQKGAALSYAETGVGMNLANLAR